MSCAVLADSILFPNGNNLPAGDEYTRGNVREQRSSEYRAAGTRTNAAGFRTPCVLRRGSRAAIRCPLLQCLPDDPARETSPLPCAARQTTRASVGTA